MTNRPVFFLWLVLCLVTVDTHAHEHGLVDVRKALPGVVASPMYARPANFMGRVLYHNVQTCYVHKDLVARLLQVQEELKAAGYCLKILDGYRPLSVQRLLFEAIPIDGFVANPAIGSNHNRGVAVDVTLVETSSGAEVPMPSAVDEFSERAWANYQGCRNPKAVEMRALLTRVMTRAGFIQNPYEWWHFNLAGAASYPVLDIPFEMLA